MLAEAFRVLKPGGRFAVSDIVFQGDMSVVPDELLHDAETWSGCVAGALEERDYLAKLERAGLRRRRRRGHQRLRRRAGELVLRRAGPA